MEKIKGLSSKEAAERLKRDGFNELPSQKPKSALSLVVGVVREPMLLLLLGSGSIYLLLGEIQDAAMLLAFVFVMIGIAFYQERKTESALNSLKNLASPRALVIRDNEQIRIPGREVVVDDLIILREGDRVPADATILSATNLFVDESLLTGESQPVRKFAWDKKTKFTQAGGEDSPFVFSGTIITQGRGLARVTAVGKNTQLGKIGKSLATITEEDTLLKKEISRIVRNFAAVGIILCLLIVIIYGLTKGNWLNGILLGLTLSMAILPEEFPVVFMVFLTLGAWRMSKKNVLTRKNQAIETFGASTVLCVDKTGTLTLNKMQLSGLIVNSVYQDIGLKTDKFSESCHQLFEYAILASQTDPFDPLEKEIKEKGEKFLANTEHIHKNWRLIKEYPLSKELLALSHVWESPDKKCYVIAAKGTPEAIGDLCHLSKEEKNKLLENIKQMADRGLRVIGVAKASFKKKDLPRIQHDFPFKYVGLLGFVDPIRPGVSDAVKECYLAGMRVIMITGDYPGTAKYIAKQAGLKNPDLYITGEQLQKMDHELLRKKIKEVNIFARVVPEQKLAIVNAFAANGEIVAMTGDGINDAPALKTAHIGIAMGERGTDVARESADLVLLTDDFFSIVSAVRLGRRIFDNLQKAIGYIFSVHIPIIGISFFPILFNFPIILYPAHVAFLELIIDPACSTVFESEKEENDIMTRPPRNLKQPIFDRKTFIFSLIQGLTILMIVMIVFLFVILLGLGETEARSLAFVTMVFSNLMLILTNLSKTENVISMLQHKNKALYYVLFGTTAALFLVLYVPFLRNLFYFSYLHFLDLTLCLGMSFLALVWLEILKAVITKKILYLHL